MPVLNNEILDDVLQPGGPRTPSGQQAAAMAATMRAPAAPTPEPAPAAHTMDRSPVPTPSTPNPAPIAPPAAVGPVPAAKPGISGPNDVSVPGIPVSRATPAPSQTPSQTAPPISPARAELNRLQSSPAGVDAIKHAGLRIPLQVLSAIGSGLFPGIAMGIPGTELHHNLLVRQAENAVNADESAANNETKRQLETAQAHHAEAEANASKAVTPHTLVTDQGIMQWNPATSRFDIPAGQPPAKEEVEGKTVTTDQGIMQWDPKSKTYSIKVGNSPEKESQGKTLQDADGVWYSIGKDNSATPITVNGKPFQGKNPEKTSTPEQQFIDEYQKTHQGASVAEAQRAYEKNKQLPPQTDRGQNFVDPTTHKLVRVEPGGAVPEGAVTASGLSGENVATEKQDAAAKKARDDAQKEYQLAQQLVANPSPTNDVALIMRYIGATKPDSLGKLRLNNNEIRLVEGTRSSLGDLEALAAKVTSGQRLTDKQRHDMLDTMRILGGIEAGSGGTRVQQNSKGEFRYSKDGGKTWQAGKPQ